MFQFANFLLIALFAAALYDFCAALRCTRSPAGALRALWREEHFFFGGWQAAARQKTGPWLFGLGVCAYELNITLCNSMARENWPILQTGLAPLLDGLLCAFLGGKILFSTRYTWRAMGVAGCFYFIARWVYFNSQNPWWFGMILVIFAAKDVPLQKPLRAFLAVGGGTMALVAALHFGGIVAPGLVSERVGEFRLTFGYGHPNTFGGLFLGLVFAFALLRAARPRWADVGVLFACGVFLWVGPGSRSAALTCFLLAALWAVYRLAPRPFAARAIPAAGAALVPLAAAYSYLLPLGLVRIGLTNTSFGPAWLAKLDSLLTRRISMVWFAYRLFDVKIAGQVLDDWPALDNTFAFSLYQFGPVVTVLWAVILAAVLYGYFRRGLAPEALCLVAGLFYALMECQSFHFTTNPAALLLCGVFFAAPPSRWPTAHSSPQRVP